MNEATWTWYRRAMRRDHAISPPSLHALVAAIERAAADDPALEVKSAARDSGARRGREHDIVVTYQRGHHHLITAIECRDRSRKVGVPEVEAFQRKCERTGVHRAIIVSSKGFSAAAIAKANQLSIGCMSLPAAQAFDWRLLTRLTRQPRKIRRIRVVPFVNGSPAAADALIAPDNTVLSPEQIKQAAIAIFDRNVRTEELTPGRHKATLRDVEPRLRTRAADGQDVKVDRVVIGYEFEIPETLAPARFHSSTDPATGETSISFDLPHEEPQATLAIAHDPASAMRPAREP